MNQELDYEDERIPVRETMAKMNAVDMSIYATSSEEIEISESTPPTTDVEGCATYCNMVETRRVNWTRCGRPLLFNAALYE